MAINFENMNESTREFLARLLEVSIFGSCYDFAVALYRGLSWPIVGLTDGVEIVHVGVKSPEGKIWDGRGEVSEEEFGKPFTKNHYAICDVAEKELLATGKVREHMVEIFLRIAQENWPELSWKQVTRRERVIAFADELEALSRKHKLWICGTVPAMLPVIFEGYGDEAGYEIKLSSDGNAYMINRKLR